MAYFGDTKILNDETLISLIFATFDVNYGQIERGFSESICKKKLLVKDLAKMKSKIALTSLNVTIGLCKSPLRFWVTLKIDFKLAADSVSPCRS